MLRKKYKYKKRKTHFFFGKENYKLGQIGKIYFKRTYNNIFITLTDLNNKVVFCETSGTALQTQNKRRKRMAATVEDIMYFIKRRMDFYNIRRVFIILKIKMKYHVYVLIKYIKKFGYKIIKIKSKRKILHSGVRGKKVRRL